MAEKTVNLEMPYILPSQAQKHVTHNEALQRLDATVQLTLRATRQSPPPSPQEGMCFAIAADAEGEWSGRDGRIAMWQDGAWLYLMPRTGWRAWDETLQALLIFTGEGWGSIPLPEDMECQSLGIATAADETNRFALSSPASLLNHAGEGHQLKINKAAAGNTASLLFQSAWSGYAEMGLNGENAFSIKVSDGTNWTTALSVSPDGAVCKPASPAFRAWSMSGSLSPAIGSQTGFDHLDNLQGEAELGGALAAGSAIRIPADGVYMLTMKLVVLSSAGHDIKLLRNGTQELLSSTGSTPLSHSVTGIARLDMGDLLSMSHANNAELACGEHKTELAGFML